MRDTIVETLYVMRLTTSCFFLFFPFILVCPSNIVLAIGFLFNSDYPHRFCAVFFLRYGDFKLSISDNLFCVCVALSCLSFF